ncbi:MAG TPA: hypothetical protein VKQ36_03155, partial [Ktedonobacterales bacterium]|nr:hypothetical protein [Ktedonobacterales bacterium]
FFEHGVFRQTVFHAHLHALPFGPVSLGLRQQALASDARPAHSLADVRDWYTERGHYFYLEEAAASHQAIGDHDEHDDHDDQGAIFGDAAIFPPEMGVYRQILGSLLSGGGALRWRLPQERYDQRGPMLQGVARAWQAFVANGG